MNLLFLHMLLQLENSNQEGIEKLLEFARKNHLELSLIDSSKNPHFLPGKPLSKSQLTKLIEASRSSGIVAMEHAHKAIRNSYNAG